MLTGALPSFTYLVVIFSVVLLYFKSGDEPALKDKRGAEIMEAFDCHLEFSARATNAYGTQVWRADLKLTLHTQDWAAETSSDFEKKDFDVEGFESYLYKGEKNNFLLVKVQLLKQFKDIKEVFAKIKTLQFNHDMRDYLLPVTAAAFPNLESVSITFEQHIYLDWNPIHSIKAKKVTLLEMESTELPEETFDSLLRTFPSLQEVSLKDLDWRFHDFTHRWGTGYEKFPRGKFDNVLKLTIDSCRFGTSNRNVLNNLLDLFPGLKDLTIKGLNTDGSEYYKEFDRNAFVSILSLNKNLQNFILRDANLTGLKPIEFQLPLKFDSPISISVETSKMNAEDSRALEDWCSRIQDCKLTKLSALK